MLAPIPDLSGFCVMKKFKNSPQGRFHPSRALIECHPAVYLRTSRVVPHSSSWTASAYEPQNPQMHPRCRRVTSRSAGNDCVNNATVCGGRRPKNRPHEKGDDSDPGLASRRGCVLTAIASRPEATGWAPLVCAGPLTTSLQGLWVSASCHRAMVERKKGWRPKNRPSDAGN